MDEELDVVVTGLDVDLRQAEAGLVRVFGIELQNARRVLRQLPLVARRGASLAIAERYVAALRSIGARVELQPTGFAGNSVDRLDAPALPVPLPSAIAGLQESLAMQRETDGAIARFRVSEGLESLRVDGDLNLINPAIPKAPAIPHDLARMPNASLPRFSDRPSWRAGGPSFGPGDSLGARPPHVDAQLPPAVSGMNFGPVDLAKSSGAATASVRPGAVGLAPHATSMSSSPRPATFSNSAATPAASPRTYRWLFLVIAIALGAYLVSLRNRDRNVTESPAFRELGVDAGEYASAPRFFADSQHGLDGINLEAAHALLDKLGRAGAPAVYALQIHERDGHKQAGALAVELPSDPNARRTVFGLLAKARSDPALEVDRGQRYALLSPSH